MRNKVKSITEKVPQVTTLPDGLYNGSWSGYIIEMTYNNKHYELQTEDGVRGIDVKVIIEVADGVASFETVKNS